MPANIFRGTYFLVISILLTVAAAVGIMNAAPDIFLILFSVSAWNIYVSARSDKALRGFSLGHGTAKALYIVAWVAVGLLILCAVVVIFFRNILGRALISSGVFGYYYGHHFNDLSRLLGSYSFLWTGLTILVIAVLLAATNLILNRSLVSLTKAFSGIARDGIAVLPNVDGVGRWLFVLGIVVSLGVLRLFSNSLGAFVSGCTGAAMIVASRWLIFEVSPALTGQDDIPRSEWYSPDN